MHSMHSMHSMRPDQTYRALQQSRETDHELRAVRQAALTRRWRWKEEKEKEKEMEEKKFARRQMLTPDNGAGDDGSKRGTQPAKR